MPAANILANIYLVIVYLLPIVPKSCELKLFITTSIIFYDMYFNMAKVELHHSFDRIYSTDNKPQWIRVSLEFFLGTGFLPWVLMINQTSSTILLFVILITARKLPDFIYAPFVIYPVVFKVSNGNIFSKSTIKTEAATGGVLWKELFLQISQYSQKTPLLKSFVS